MKDANRSTNLDAPVPSDQPPVEVPPTGKKPQDARDDPAQQERNREEMGVTPDHKTGKMKEEKRGTFP
jgi:hypothetical protein